MKFKTSKQGYLKGLLLLALIANISWEPILVHLNEELNSSVSGMGEALGGGGLKADFRPVTSGSSGPVKLSIGPGGAQVDKSSSIQPDAALTVEKPGAPPSSNSELSPKNRLARHTTSNRDPEVKTFCDRTFRYEFSQVVRSGRAQTEIRVTEPFSDSANPIEFTVQNIDGTLALNLDNSESRRQIDEILKRRLRQRIENCADLGTSQSTTTASGEKNDSEEERRRIRAGVAACTMNDSGQSLNDIERVRCQIRKITRLSVNERNRSESRDRVIRDIENLIRGDIRRIIKSRLSSSDEGKNEEGEELLEEAIEAVESAKDTNDLDERKASRLVSELRALRVGGETVRATARYTRDSKDLRQEFRDRYNDVLRDPDLARNPGLRDLLISQLRLGYSAQGASLFQQAQFDLHDPLLKLQLARSQGFITAMDFTDFTNPFRQLRTDLLQLSNPNYNPALLLGGGGLPTADMLAVPGDLGAYRLGLRTSFPRAGGITLPGRAPNLNLGNFGVSSTILNPRGFHNGIGGPALTPTFAPAGSTLWNQQIDINRPYLNQPYGRFGGGPQVFAPSSPAGVSPFIPRRH